ncbi:MAG TPA: NFACT RNA binding domain-containing protein, partial [Candidatus Kapabacteria bacterium]|nr:NFACT RNA binding domain-containing protein [Candidatus Kapabacteria bacterium]
PKLSIIENAQKYYEKSKKIIKEIDLIKSKIDKLQKSLDVHQYLSTKLHSIKNYKEFKTLFNELVNYKIIPQTTNKSKELDKFKFKKFDLTSGYKLLVGKNAENNDLLTFKFARPHDLWLHTKGASGSHAIIPLNKKQIVPAEIIRKAAEITAYYSSLRNANYVPVVYTEKKYIRKPKGAKPGAVIVTRGKTIFVEPNINKIMSNNNLIEDV